MHDQAASWVFQHATREPVAVLDLGGRDINGTMRVAFPHATVYRTVDLYPGPGVDIVADAATWQPDALYDYVVTTECFEHTPVWPDICETAYKACKPGGTFIATMAGPGRAPHSGIDGTSGLHTGEWYANIHLEELRAVLDDIGWRNIIVDQQVSPQPCDTRCVATKGEQ